MSIFNNVPSVYPLLSKDIRSDVISYNSLHSKMDESNTGNPLKSEKITGIEKFWFHDLRHTFATRVVQVGEDLYKVQKFLEHKTPIMTQRHAHHHPESLRGAVDNWYEKTERSVTI